MAGRVMDWAARLAERRENFSECPSGELTKPTKPPFGSIVSTQNGPFQNKQARKPDLFARCRDACRGLALWPQELAAALDESDRAAILGGDPAELLALRTMAEGLAGRLRTGKLPKNLHEAYARLRKELARRPGIRFACEVLTPDDDPVLIACAIRGRGFITLRIAKERYNEAQLLEIIDRVNPGEGL